MINTEHLKDINYEDLETFQRLDIPNSSDMLSRYDKFYRLVGPPLILMNIQNFMDDLKLLEKFTEWKTTNITFS